MQTTIEWTDYTLQPGIYGCSIASPACENCYAATMAHRQAAMGNYPLVTGRRGSKGIHWTGEVRVNYDAIAPAFAKLPQRKPARVFVTSMADLFHADVPFEFVAIVYGLMASMPHLTFQVLTKRPDRMAEFYRTWTPLQRIEAAYAYMGGSGLVAVENPRQPVRLTMGVYSAWASIYGRAEPDHVWAGTTVEDQKRADERIPHLLKVPARVRFLSCEPLLGPVDLRHVAPKDDWHIDALDTPDPAFRINWVIDGGESGRQARPTHPDWFRAVRDACEATNTAYFHKQNGEWAGSDDIDAHGVADFRYGEHYPEDGGVPRHMWRDAPVRETVRRLGKGEIDHFVSGDTTVYRVGKKAAGRLLDGVEHSAFPEVA